MNFFSPFTPIPFSIPQQQPVHTHHVRDLHALPVAASHIEKVYFPTISFQYSDYNANKNPL